MGTNDIANVSSYVLLISGSERPELLPSYRLYSSGANIEFRIDTQQAGQVQKVRGSVTTKGEKYTVEISIAEGGCILKSICRCCTGDSTWPCEHAGAVLFKMMKNGGYQVAGKTSKGQGVTAVDVILPLAIGATAIVAAPIALTVAGFSSAGIVGGSLAAKMMSAAAVANGGGVAAGGAVAVLQSAGAAGVGAAGNAVIGTVAGGVTVVGRKLWQILR